MIPEKSRWTPVTDLMTGGRKVCRSRSRASWFKGSWRQALCFAAYYKFASKMIGRGKRVLDIGCGEGLGTWMLAKECAYAKGIDLDRESIAVAQKNWVEERINFECSGIDELKPQVWDALVILNANGGFLAKSNKSFFESVKRNLSHDGIAILGAPAALSVKTIKPTRLRLEVELKRHFQHVFMFSACDEMIHAGSLRTADHWIAVGCRKKSVKKGMF